LANLPLSQRGSYINLFFAFNTTPRFERFGVDFLPFLQVNTLPTHTQFRRSPSLQRESMTSGVTELDSPNEVLHAVSTPLDPNFFFR